MHECGDTTLEDMGAAPPERYELANRVEEWDLLWEKERESPWRAEAMQELYARIAELCAKAGPGLVVDVGGGDGALADVIRAGTCREVLVVDHSRVALEEASRRGHPVQCTNLVHEELALPAGAIAVVCATELLEHLDWRAMNGVLKAACDSGAMCFFSVPNNCLGPDEEPQHARKLTTVQYLQLLRKYWPGRVRIEYYRHWQLAICNEPRSAQHETVSVCFPARDEAADIERVLKSFRPVADEIVVGIDPRSSDRTEEIARAYAEKVFLLEDPQGSSVDGEAQTDDAKAVHFSHLRNQCIDRCECEWIFMTEAHEELFTGHETLLNIGDIVPKPVTVCLVFRTAEEVNGHVERWGYPWLLRRSAGIHYTRRVHNIPEYPEGTYVTQLLQINTLHRRDINNAAARSAQRKTVNRKALMEDWIYKGDPSSLYYLGSEWRTYDDERAVARLEQLLALPPKNGPMRYQARLIIAKTRQMQGRWKEAIDVLLRCPEDDWARTEHWIWLGDLAFEHDDYPRALQWYLYASTTIGHPPFTHWWIDLANYSYLPAQRLAMCYAAMGRGEEALNWAENVTNLVPERAPDELKEECIRNRDFLREALAKKEKRDERAQDP